MEIESWQKYYLYARIVIIFLLGMIVLGIVWFRFGYVDPDDSALFDMMGNRTVSCELAMYYYAEHEWGVTTKPVYQRDLPSSDIILEPYDPARDQNVRDAEGRSPDDPHYTR